MAITKPTVGATGWNTAVDAVIDHANVEAGNPHGTTKAQVGLGSVDNTSDAAKPLSTAATTALAGKAAASHTHGVADLTATGTRSSSTYLRGDGTWSTPPSGGGGGAVDSVNGQTGTVNLTATSVGAAATSHTHAVGDLPVAASGASSTTQLVRADDSRLSNARTPTTHAHAVSDVTGLQTALDAKSATGHAHAVSDVTGLQAALDAKASLAAAAAVTNAGGNLSVSLAATVGPVQPVTLTGTAVTLNAVTNATGGRRLLLEVLASGATRSFGIASPVVNGSDATFPLSIPTGKVALVGLYYPVGAAYPIVVSAKVMP